MTTRIRHGQASAPVRPTTPLGGGGAPSEHGSDTNAVSSSARVQATGNGSAMPPMGNKVVMAAAQLIQQGYVYPPNLTTNYYHIPGKVGCCADFVADSYKAAGFDLGAAVDANGGYAANANSMMQYFQQHQTFHSGPTPAHVGDAIFFSWSGGSTAEHTAIVTKVDANGTPTEIMESSNFGQPAHASEVTPYMLQHTLGVGQLSNATSNDSAANNYQTPTPVAGATSGPAPGTAGSGYSGSTDNGGGYVGSSGAQYDAAPQTPFDGNYGSISDTQAAYAPADMTSLLAQLEAMGISKSDLEALAKKYGVPLQMILAIIMAESGGNPNAKSGAGALGLMQLMPGTAQGLGFSASQMTSDPKANVEAGTKLLGQLYSQVKADPRFASMPPEKQLGLVAAAYNAGYGAVSKYGGIPPYAETQAYVPKVEGYMGQVKS